MAYPFPIGGIGMTEEIQGKSRAGAAFKVAVGLYLLFSLVWAHIHTTI